MEKIPTLFVRNEQTHRIEPLLTPGCEWVLAGEGRPTRKVDGTAVLVRQGRCFKRREVKPGRQPPDGFQEVETDETTGKRVGWAPIRPGDPVDRYFVEGINNARYELGPGSADGRTFELVGPKVQPAEHRGPRAPRDHPARHQRAAPRQGSGGHRRARTRRGVRAAERVPGSGAARRDRLAPPRRTAREDQAAGLRPPMAD